MLSGFTYTVRMPATTISTAITILQVKAGAATPLEILRWSLWQRGSVTSVQESVQMLRKSAAATVTSATPAPHATTGRAADAAGGTSATGYNASAEGTDSTVIDDMAFNVLSGIVWLPTPEERIWVPSGGFFALKFPNAPASQSWRASIVFREFPG